MEESSKGVLRKIYLSSQLKSCVDLNSYLKVYKSQMTVADMDFFIEPLVINEWNPNGTPSFTSRLVVVSNVIGDKLVLIQNIIEDSKKKSSSSKYKVLFPKLENANGYSVDVRTPAKTYSISEYKTNWYLTFIKDSV